MDLPEEHPNGSFWQKQQKDRSSASDGKILWWTRSFVCSMCSLSDCMVAGRVVLYRHHATLEILCRACPWCSAPSEPVTLVAQGYTSSEFTVGWRVSRGGSWSDALCRNSLPVSRAGPHTPPTADAQWSPWRPDAVMCAEWPNKTPAQ